MKIYLSGKVPKQDNEFCEDWREYYQKVLLSKKYLSNKLEFIEPMDSNLDESNFELVYGHDCSLIKNCDLVIVNAEDKTGIGTSQEILIAKYYKKYVVIVIPENTDYCRKNITLMGRFIETWIHPFAYVSSDLIINDIKDIDLEFINEEIKSGRVKDISLIDKACDLYEKSN
ncbi:MAG: hypothetical protein K2J20_02955 [Bacilli bacterium]|nr:hypothetical protein [Bacilli bacterium]